MGLEVVTQWSQFSGCFYWRLPALFQKFEIVSLYGCNKGCNRNEGWNFRGSHHRCYIKKNVLKNFAKFTGKYLCQSLFFSKISLFLVCFPVNFAKLQYCLFSWIPLDDCYQIYLLTYFGSIFHFYNPLNVSVNLLSSDVVRVYRNRRLVWNRLIL